MPDHQVVNEHFTAPSWLPGKTKALYPSPDAIKKVMDEKFDGGKTFDFNNFNHRVTLGIGLVDQEYAK